MCYCLPDQKQDTIMSALLQHQFLFARMLPGLLDQAHALGYEVTVGEAYRTPAQAALNQKAGIGIGHSLHTRSLAIDLHLFKGESFLTETICYQALGEWWEQQGGSWGGRFNDGNHFSLMFEGIR